MKKEIAIFLMLAFVVLAVSLILVKFVKVVHAGCCETVNGCSNVDSRGECYLGTYHGGQICCSSSYCAYSCETTTTCQDECSRDSDCGTIHECNVGHCGQAPDCGTMCVYTPKDSYCDDGIACTVDKCTSSGCTHTPDDSLCDAGYHCTLSGCEEDDNGGGDPHAGEHGHVCRSTSPQCVPGQNLECMSGGCNVESVCCYEQSDEHDQEYAYCDDPPGGVAVSYCAKSKGTDPKCTYCKDLNGEHYNVGDCVTTDPSVCSSGWMICTDTCDTSQNPPVYEWGCEDHPEQNCPNYGGSGSTTTTSSTSTTTIPYDVLSVSYASLHNGANPAFPALQVNCSVSQRSLLSRSQGILRRGR